jgi:GNAT superfamily N-acetyltransferase
MSAAADDDLALRPLTRDELDELVEWAAGEGWNPGLGDADVFWRTDPEAFAGYFGDGELLGGGSIVSYDGRHGFLGLYIVRPDLRGRGIGRRLWADLCETLAARLDAGASIGIDGVFEMQDFYATTGFRFSHRNLRMGGVGQASPSGADAGLQPLAALPFEAIAEFDAAHFGVERPGFLRGWIDPPGGLGLALLDGSELRAAGVARPCREGFKVGPLFARDEDAAERVFSALSAHAEGRPLFLDIPEVNAGAVALAARHGMHEVFGCARMYMGAAPPIAWERVYGVTTFELG